MCTVSDKYYNGIQTNTLLIAFTSKVDHMWHQNFPTSSHFGLVLVNLSHLWWNLPLPQFLPSTVLTALVRDRNLEECLQQHEIGQQEFQAEASADYMRECCGTPLYLPLELLQYYQSLYWLSVAAEKEIGAQPAVTNSGPYQPPLQTTTATFQVGQGHCCVVKGTERLSETKKLINFVLIDMFELKGQIFMGFLCVFVCAHS